MIRWIVGTSLRARGAVVAIVVALTVFGFWQIRSTRVDSLPEFSPPTVQIRTEALGLSAPEVESLITVPLEQDLLAGVPWLDTVTSESIPGLSSIDLIFEPGTNPLHARQVVQERLTQSAGLPNVSSPPQMLQPRSSTSRIMMIRLSSKTVSPIKMSVLARWVIRPRLLGVPGVASVSTWGQRERQLQVQVDPHRLEAHGLTLEQVIETTGNALWESPLTYLEASTPGTGGFIDTSNQRLGIQHLSPIATAANLAKVPIDTGKGQVLRLSDVADVVENHQPLIGDAVFTDGIPSLLLVVEKFPGTNTLDVTKGVEDALDELKPGLSGINIDPTIYRPATYIERGIHDLGTALLLGLLLLILALGAFMLEWRSAVIGLVAILASLLTAWLVLYLRQTTINMMVLAGLVMGLAAVIDDAVVGVDNAARRLREHPANGTGPSPSKIILEAVVEMRSAAVYATLIAFVAVVPLFFLQGRAAPFVPSILLSYGLAIVSSMVVALTVTPALCLILLSGTALQRRESPLAMWLARGYDRLLTGVAHAPAAAYVAAGVVVLASLVVLPYLRQSALPSFRDGDVLIDWNAAPGTSLPEMDRITTRAARELAALPGILDVGAHVGRAIDSDQVVGVNSGQLWVKVDPAADYDATLASIRKVVAGYPGIDCAVRTYSDERIRQVLSTNDHPIVVRVFGQDLDALHSTAEKVKQAMASVDGVVHPAVEIQSVEPTIDVSVDLRKAEHYGIVPGDVRRTAATLLSGIGVGSLFEQQKVFDVVVWGTPKARNSLSSVRDLLIDTPNGGHVRLGRVADVAIASTPTDIRHQDDSRTIDVTADVQGRDVGSVAADVKSRLRDMRFPLEYHAELLGDYSNRQAAHRLALEVALAAAIGVFLLLEAAFGSWRLAAVSFLALPLALAGGLLAVRVRGGTVSLGSVAGFFAVLGISVRAGVTSIRHFQHLERDEAPALGPELILRGARERFMPIVASAVAAGLAILPLAVSGNAAGQEIVQPMALVILGGLVTSTLLNLFVVPSLYLRSRPTAAPEPTPAEVP